MWLQLSLDALALPNRETEDNEAFIYRWDGTQFRSWQAQEYLRQVVHP
jgi:hypothetical protein